MLNDKHEQLFLDLRVQEIALHDEILDHVREVHEHRLWKDLGYRSIREFCENHLGYTSSEARDILISLGEILTSDGLTSQDPSVQTRIVNLRNWRRRKSIEQGLPAYRIFSNHTLLNLAQSCPQDRDGLLQITGIGEKKWNSFGKELLELLRAK